MAVPNEEVPLKTSTLEPASLLPESTSEVSSVVSPEDSVPVTNPTLSVAVLNTAVGAAVSPITVQLAVALLVLPAASVSLTLN